MKDIEDLLKRVPLSEPSESLDNRVEASVSNAEQRHAGRRPAGIPLWAFATGCLACTLIGFFLHPLVEQPPPTADGPGVVYIIEPSRPDLRIFGTKPDREKTTFWQEKRGELKPLVRN